MLSRSSSRVFGNFIRLNTKSAQRKHRTSSALVKLLHTRWPKLVLNLKKFIFINIVSYLCLIFENKLLSLSKYMPQKNLINYSHPLMNDILLKQHFNNINKTRCHSANYSFLLNTKYNFSNAQSKITSFSLAYGRVRWYCSNLRFVKNKTDQFSR